MGKDSAIQWTTHTWNPWRGCTRVSPGCLNCYMFREQRRYGRDPEVVTRCGKPVFNAPHKWEANAAALDERQHVFTCSWSDFFHTDADEWRADAWQVIRTTPHLVYQILTKRPALVEKRLPPDWGDGWDNVWIGISAEDQDHYERRWRVLREIPATVRFISYEPGLGPLNITALDGDMPDWIIAGGESGPDARAFNLSWARFLIEQCRVAGVPVFMKQVGSRPYYVDRDGRQVGPFSLRDDKGGDPDEWPRSMRVRQSPNGRCDG